MSKVRASELILQNQNLGVPYKPAAAKGVSNSISKTSQKKGGGLGNRKALQDISNSSSVRQETLTRKKNHPKAASSCAEEMFLHDHKRCIDAEKAERNKHLLDVLLFEHDLLYPATSPKSKQVEFSFESPLRYLELERVPELQIPEVFDCCPSPIQWNSPPPSPSRYELPELVLKSCINDETLSSLCSC